MSINRRRLLALCRKETLQIVRDPSSILIAFIMPVVLLVVMGYAINLDVDHLRLGIWRTDSGAPAVRLEQALRGSTALEIHSGPSKESLLASLARGEIRGLLVIDDGFSRALALHQRFKHRIRLRLRPRLRDAIHQFTRRLGL